MSDWIQPGHLFSQHSLNTYLRCQRRFQLTYIERQPWPMPEEEDPRAYQQYLERGTILHHWLVRRHLGIDMEPIVAACEDEELRRWWRAAQEFDDSALPGAEGGGVREAELPVVVSLGEYSLYARYDYVAIGSGVGQTRVGDPRPDVDAVILDWKTLERVPSLRVLRQRVQTRVYLYSLVTAGHVLTGGAPLDPERVEMWYWFANYPEETARIAYSRAAYREDEAWLRALVVEIATRPQDAFALTDDHRECRRCHYRTLCDRAAKGAPGADALDGEDWLQEEIDLAIDMELSLDADVPALEY